MGQFLPGYNEVFIGSREELGRLVQDRLDTIIASTGASTIEGLKAKGDDISRNEITNTSNPYLLFERAYGRTADDCCASFHISGTVFHSRFQEVIPRLKK